MNYKGYEAVIRYSDEDATFVGEVINTKDTLVFDGDNVVEVEQSFHLVVDEYIEDCLAEGKEPEKPFSGQFVMRIKPELHRELFIKARQSGLSLNAFVSNKLHDAVF
ncbi:MAG: toxin-antitoxin system HicB family antitoxin [SAR86 cluster bacterium]|uniref:Toxin-antitoxin system HicB family antitoxin n=1 Tax=SAR86 cluster bacterium TaxID=2030880 RepID=A0A2A5CGB1_9GAMM|nr:MAG: toxin-antitoxin system HicB family antitoxin [SAR86 cluster bacterium]